MLAEETEGGAGASSPAGTLSSGGGTLGGDAKMAWLHEHLTRDKSEATLRGLGMGTFLLRTSSSPGDY